MDVYGQVFGAHLDKDKSMFDFNIAFFIVNPKMREFEAFYSFDKVAKSGTKGKGEQIILGHDDPDTNEKKPYHYDTLTGSGIGRGVDAQVKLLSSDDDKFTVTMWLTHKRGHSVTASFQGSAPSWLVGDKDKPVFSGKLMLIEVKDLRPKKLPGL